MKKVFICIFWVLLFINVVNAKESRNLLVINSYHKGLDWSDIIIKGMEDTLRDTDVDMSILYMDSKRVNSKEYYDKLRDLYKIQLAKHSYDMVVAIDNFAYKFILKNYTYFNMKQPLFFVGMEYFSQSEVEKSGLQDKVSGIMERRAILDNIEEVHKIMPNLKKLYIINDDSENGKDTDPQIKKAIKKYSKFFKIEYIRNITLDNPPKNFLQYKKNEAIFFVRFYNDSKGKFYDNGQIASFINKAKLPVFVTDGLFIKKGAVGGKLVDIKELGIQSVNRILKILDGKLSTPKIEIADKFNYTLDYKKIKEFHIPMTYIDEKFSFVNAPLKFLDKYRDFVNLVFIVSPFLLLLILGLFHNIYLRSQNTKRLNQRIRFDKELLNALRSPTIWQNQNGEKVDCNTRFEEFLEEYSIYGKSLGAYIKEHNLKYLIEIIKSSINKDNPQNEIILQNKNGVDKIFLFRQREYKEEIYNTSGVVTVFTNITTEKEAILEKSKQQEFTIQQSKLAEVGEIFSSIAHQWKSPLVEIAAIVQEHFYLNEDEVDEQNSSYVNDVMIQVRYMSDTIEEFQEFIKPSNKKVIFDIYEEIKKILHIMDHNIRYNYIDISVNVQDGTNLKVYGYKNELKQTILNIINNSKDAISRQKKLKNIKKGKINIELKNIDNFIQISIQDNAKGIPKDCLANIFDPYFTTKEEGHGIGLYMAKIIIEDKMGGQIYAKNEDDGAKFIIKLEQNIENTTIRR